MYIKYKCYKIIFAFVQI